MKKGRILSYLLFALLIVILAGLGFYIYSGMMKQPERQIVIEKVPEPVKTKEPVFQEPVTITEEKPEVFSSVIEEESPLEISAEEDYCTQIETNIADFFKYLDTKPAIRLLGTGMDSFMHFKLILKKLAERPPVPAGEGVYPKIIIRNMYHFFRVLDKSDILLLKEILKFEQDSIETDLEMFYTWLTLHDRCPDKERIRPSLDVLYKYAGFFLNTMGGRAYLARRSADLRLLLSYYSVLIIHETDKNRANNYGIDIVPFIKPLHAEISRYPELKYQEAYISQLKTIENYYLSKR
ncbi:MAG TPA: hypothetical protein PK874_06530 [Desulfobacteraceae bacterium]|nr:hypothetical protein [Desulfobacteraceae bacterium]HPJ67415.1 hypothetical protein [Desulfobacteraceae bacterium]HPQ28753.1 hypothetical protein [Desulfobacteraceae bacterium]